MFMLVVALLILSPALILSLDGPMRHPSLTSLLKRLQKHLWNADYYSSELMQLSSLSVDFGLLPSSSADCKREVTTSTPLASSNDSTINLKLLSRRRSSVHIARSSYEVAQHLKDVLDRQPVELAFGTTIMLVGDIVTHIGRVN
ncbi:hypothetical protein CRM22_010326 [Opisthorchis felineus]|uniref:Uncharacterized protein n=1 Tax=Opisthorchis felineus TaxID=147828 RepID=A0A4S2L5F7_OPIFE|nr:hypothetical protein CRM22_010326 [Opisthorchis felineus]